MNSGSLQRGQILKLFLPLAATSTMMSASVPIINAGMARLENPEANLAAFGLAFGVSILLESPVFALQQSVTAWYPGHGSVRPTVMFAVIFGLVVFLLEAVVAFTPMAHAVFARVLGAEPHLAASAVTALRVAVFFAPVIAVRCALQAILVSRRTAGPIGWGTFLRLLLLALLVVVVAPRTAIPGPAAGMAALLAAVILETIYVGYAVRRSPEYRGAETPAQASGRTNRGKFRFILPLSGMLVLATLTNPLIHAFITRTPNAERALAAYSVVFSLVWFTTSPFLRMAAVAITYASSPETRRIVSRFVWDIAGVVTAVVILVQLTPVWRPVLVGMMGLSEDLAAWIRWPLVCLGVLPLVVAHMSLNQGLLVREARTVSVGWGGAARVISILSLGLLLGAAASVNGLILGSILLGVSFLAEFVVLYRAAHRHIYAGPMLF